MAINSKATDAWRRYLAETDPVAAEMLRQEYIRALQEPEDPPTDGPSEDELDRDAEQLPIGAGQRIA